MRSTLAAALIGLFLLPAATMAQTATQTAAVDAANAVPAAPTATSPTGGISRDQDRAGQRAATRFDQMDANHDGMLDRAEIQAWRTEHPRRSRSQSNQPTQ